MIDDQPCPTCGAETRRLHAVTIYGDYCAFHCHRCGTLVEVDGHDNDRGLTIIVPGVVDLIRKLAR